MTIKQAVINVCNAMTPGQKLLGYQFYDKVIDELIRNGSKQRPLSDTVLRRFREVREVCGMESHHSVSEYRKKEVVQLTDEEKVLGQMPMF